MSAFKKQEVIDRILNRCISERVWRSEAIKECLALAERSERRAVEEYVRARYERENAGYAGRWQS